MIVFRSRRAQFRVVRSEFEKRRVVSGQICTDTISGERTSGSERRQTSAQLPRPSPSHGNSRSKNADIRGSTVKRPTSVSVLSYVSARVSLPSARVT
jgi:hypothetical protein